MSLCIDPGYEVISNQVTVLEDNGGLAPQEFRLSVPTGKKPLSGGFNMTYIQGHDHPTPYGSYPDGSDWVFLFKGVVDGDRTVDLYMVCEYV